MSTTLAPITGVPNTVVAGATEADSIKKPDGAQVSLPLNVDVKLTLNEETLVFPKAVTAAFRLSRDLASVESKNAMLGSSTMPRAGIARYMPPAWFTAGAVVVSGIAACCVDYASVVFLATSACGLAQANDAWRNRVKKDEKVQSSELLHELREAYDKLKAEAAGEPETLVAVHNAMIGFLTDMRSRTHFGNAGNALYYDVLTEGAMLPPADPTLQQRVGETVAELLERSRANESRPAKKFEAEQCANDGERIGLARLLAPHTSHYLMYDLREIGKSAEAGFRALYEQFHNPDGQRSEDRQRVETPQLNYRVG